MKATYYYLLMGLFTVGVAAGQSPIQPVLGRRSGAILRDKSLTFKDLNKNNKLDPYEDWRLPIAKRVDNLLAQMTLEEKVGVMLISTTRMDGDNAMQPNAMRAGTRPAASGSTERSPTRQGPSDITSGFNKEDLVQSNNVFTRQPLPTPVVSAAGTTKGVMNYHLRHFILRANPPARTLAEWSNNLQALCETPRLGIPAIVASNPRNHVTLDAAIGLSVGKTAFSIWPGEMESATKRSAAKSA